VGVKVKDVISLEMICKFYFKKCEVTVRKIDNIVDVRMMGVSEGGYILNNHKAFIIDTIEIERGILIFIEAKMGYVEKMYDDLIDKGIQNDSKIMFFENS